jgi:rubrerythrin
MSLSKLFYLIKSAEGQTAEFYDRIRLDLAVQNPSLSDFFGELADDERLHEKQVELIQTIFLNSKDAFLEKEGAETEMEVFLAALEEARLHYRRDAAVLKPSDLLRMARDLETSLLERHRTFFLETTDPGIRKLLESLNLADEYHLRRLTDIFAG